MSTQVSRLAGPLALAFAFLLAPAAAAAPQAEGPTPLERRVEGPIAEVTVYPGRAGVTRRVAAPETPGLWDLRLGGLPASIDPASLRAAVIGGKLLDLRYEQRTIATEAATDPELRAAIERLEGLRQARLETDFAQKVLDGDGKLLDAIAARIADAAAKEAGGGLDPARLGEQIEFLGGRRAALAARGLELVRRLRKLDEEIRAAEADVARRGGESRIEREAVATVATFGGPASVDLTYLVWGAGWRPSYAVRADPDAGTLSIEFDALIRQASGEDWNGVALAVSTASPTRRPLPPAVPPTFVGPLPPPVPASEGGSGGVRAKAAQLAMDAAPGAPVAMSIESNVEVFSRAIADAEATATGSVVSYAIPRAVSIPSDASAERKTRVATIEAKPSFSLVTRPLVDPAVYAKATARNDSPYLLLAGPAAVFVGGDSVGTARLDDVPVGGEMTFWLGADRRIEAKRTLVSKLSETSGLFEKSAITTWKRRIDLVNTGDRAVEVTVEDREPVSRDERIKVELKDLSRPLSTDADYLRDERPQGILRWTVSLPARPAGGAAGPQPISWTTIVRHPVDLAIVPVPD